MDNHAQRRHRILAGAATGVICLLQISGTWAQQAEQPGQVPSPQPQDPLPEGGAAETPATAETIVVTGSRIARPDFESPNPVVSVDSESIQLSGTTNLTEYLTDQPALVGSFDSAQTTGSAANAFIGSTGLNLLNLRNLGTERTLVLVDGRRHVGQLPETAAVDVNTIPVDLIERIDIATGGVSAVYGADAVSGVVNFVMKKDFEGVTARGQYGFGDGGKPVDWHASLAAGMNFGGGRGNISAAFEYTREGRLQATDRNYLRRQNYRTMQRNPDDPEDDPNLPDEVPLTDIRFYDSSREGGIDIDFDGVPDLRPNGQPFEIPLFIPPFYSQGGTGTHRADYIGDIIAKNRRYVANVFLNYELADWARLFAEVKYARGKSFSLSQPTFDFFIEYAPDNPLIPDVIRPQVEEAGGLLLNRDNFDLGVRGEDNKRETWRTVVGSRGDFAENLSYELSYVYGQSKVRSISTNNRFNDRFFAAQDVVVDPATGRLVCAIDLDPTALPVGFEDRVAPDDDGIFESNELSFTPGPNSGCRPLNLFGEGVADPAAIDFVMTDSRSTSKITQHVVTGFVNGNLGRFALPGGPISFVVGGEWRRETSRSTPPLEDQAGLTFGNVILPTRGSFEVKEAFAEIRLPIFEDRPFFQMLELNGAIRQSDYTTVGSTTTWNVGATWAPVDDLSFRGTYAQSVRAPNIAELFSPQSQTFEFIDDPCDTDFQNNGSSSRPANCAAILTALGLDPANFEDPNSATVAGLQRGNANLSEETAKSWTAGAIFRPSFLPGLSVAVDWYDIKIKDAISQAEAEEVAENCVDAPSLDNVFCAALTRDPLTGAISSFIVQPENVARFRTSGLDFNINYRLDPADLGVKSDIGLFNFRVVGNYLDKLSFVPAPGAELDDDRSEQFAPKWQATFDLTWALDPVTVNYGFNYYSKTKRYSLEDLEGDPDFASPENITFNSRHTHEVQVSVDVADTGLNVYAGINNLFNQKPDISTNYPVNPVGRFFYAGVRANFSGF